MDIETVAMQIIAYSGDARTKAYLALQKAKDKDFESAYTMMEEAKAASIVAHKAQTELLFSEARGEIVPINILLVHSQDHLMTSMLALELIEEMILLYGNK